jgi:hypothetical protein
MPYDRFVPEEESFKDTRLSWRKDTRLSWRMTILVIAVLATVLWVAILATVF